MGRFTAAASTIGLPFEVVGLDKPLSQAEYDAFQNQKNSNFDRKNLDPNTYYHSHFCDESVLQSFPTVHPSETILSFYARQFRFFEQLLENAKKPLYKPQLRFNTRRLVFVQDRVGVGSSTQRGYPYKGLSDTDGIWRDRKGYIPTASGHWNEDLKVDLGMAHEVGHGTYKLGEQYRLDILNPLPDKLAKITPPWLQYYDHRNRVDIAKDELMYNCGYSLGVYSAEQIYRRVDHHDETAKLLDMSGWPYEFSPVKLQLTDIHGNPLPITQLEVYKSQGFGDQKQIVDQPVLRADNLRQFDPTSIFFKDSIVLGGKTYTFDMVNDHQAVALFVGTTPDQQQYVSWRTSLDFNLAHWRKWNTMQWKMAKLGDSEKDWRYDVINPNQQVVPVIYSKNQKAT